MNTLRTAAQQALEALEKLVVGSEYEEAVEAERAMDALRAALAEPVQEPVYLEVCCDAHPKWMRVNQRQFDEYVAHGWEGRRLYATPPQRPAGPVAYSEGRTLHWHDGKGVNDAQLYLAPPLRKPLTEDEIDGLVIQHAGYGQDNFYAVTRAIERAHGITS